MIDTRNPQTLSEDDLLAMVGLFRQLAPKGPKFQEAYERLIGETVRRDFEDFKSFQDFELTA